MIDHAMFTLRQGCKALIITHLIVYLFGPILCWSHVHARQLSNVNRNFGSLRLCIAMMHLCSLLPTWTDCMRLKSDRSGRGQQTTFPQHSDRTRRAAVLHALSTPSIPDISSQPVQKFDSFDFLPKRLPHTQHNCDPASLPAYNNGVYNSNHLLPSQAAVWHTNQTIYNPLSVLAHRMHASKTRVTDSGKAFVYPCFDPNEVTHVTAQVYSTARIPCTVYNIDFQSTVMSWWKDGSLRELTVGNEVSNARYSLDTSNPRSWTLVIQNVTREDAGDYICQINLSKLREKFYRLIITEPQVRMDATKLNDGYVKDEAIGLYNSTVREVVIDSDLRGVVGKPHMLSCTAIFHHVDQTAEIQWFHGGRKLYPHGAREHTDDTKWDNSRPKISIRLSSLTGQLTDITNRWINNRTMYSVLRISSLSKDFAGPWKCRKFSRNLLEPQSEDTLVLTVNDPYRGTNGNDSGSKQPRFVSNQGRAYFSRTTGRKRWHIAIGVLIAYFPKR